MGSIVMHLYIGNKIKEKYKFGNDFLIGCVLPDIYKVTTMSRMSSHYLFKYEDKENGLLFLPDLVKFMREKKDKKEDEITLGYFSHLIEDYIWFRHYTGKFAISIGFDTNGNELFTYDKENHKVVHPIDEFQNEIYEDYSYLDNKLFSELGIDLEEFKKNLKDYLNDSEMFDKAIDRLVTIHEPEENRENKFITNAILQEYIEKSLAKFDDYFLKFKEDKYTDIFDVAIAKCKDYSDENVKNAFDEVLGLLGNLSDIEEGSKVAIKANLVTFMKPEKAATTHPNLLKELCRRLLDKKCEVIVGDSPAGPYNAMNLNNVYKSTGLQELVEIGVKLNDDFSTETVKFPDGKVCREFPFTSYLKKADYVIDFCKLKSHGMMGMSCAVKNFFGVIPGTIKPEFHFRFSNYNDFANMLIDLNEYVKPCLTIVDAVVAMEGNGPTAGEPKQIGLLLASKNQYKLDVICANIIGLEAKHVPTIEESIKRGFTPEKIEEISTNLNVEGLIVKDFDTRKVHQSLWFDDESKLIGRLAKALLKSKPKLNKKLCVGCQKCKEVCPAKAISMKDNKPVIDRKKCIKCFCCQEFCPHGAMKVKRTFIAKLFTK